METKVVAFDIYGTMLPTVGTQRKRKGLDRLLERCKKQGLTLCTCSDAYTESVLSDFRKAGLDKRDFDRFFNMPRETGVYGHFTRAPKNIKLILDYYLNKGTISSSDQLTVVGDRELRDIKPALRLGCNTILVSEYYEKNDNDFDINGIIIP